MVLLTESVDRWDSIPQGSFSADTTQGCVQLAVNFTNTSTGAINSYKWDFGTDNLDSAITRDAAFTFVKADTYLVKLTITGIAGQDSYTQVIIVDSIPTTDITASDSTVDAGVPVNFTQTSTHASHFLWDFGDGRLDSTSTNPSISYSVAGTFVVRFTVTNTCSTATDSISIDVVVP